MDKTVIPQPNKSILMTICERLVQRSVTASEVSETEAGFNNYSGGTVILLDGPAGSGKSISAGTPDIPI